MLVTRVDDMVDVDDTASGLPAVVSAAALATEVRTVPFASGDDLSLRFMNGAAAGEEGCTAASASSADRGASKGVTEASEVDGVVAKGSVGSSMGRSACSSC